MRISIVFISLFVSLMLQSCKKGDLPTVTTKEITAITMTTATGGGNVTADGGQGVVAKGICWSENPNPTLNDITSLDGTGLGEYPSYLTKLHAGTLYHVRAYATNKTGTAYGDDVTFTTY